MHLVEILLQRHLSGGQLLGQQAVARACAAVAVLLPGVEEKDATLVAIRGGDLEAEVISAAKNLTGEGGEALDWKVAGWLVGDFHSELCMNMIIMVNTDSC